MIYHDTYVSSPDLETLTEFLSMFVNYIQPSQGRDATPGTEDTPAQEAVGDPSLWYSCVRGVADIAPIIPANIHVVPVEEGSAVCGVWA